MFAIHLSALHESLVGCVLVRLISEVGHINHFKALTVPSDDVTHGEVHDVGVNFLFKP